MKVAKNMDTVFADCTDDELGFEAMFDEDDCLIELVAGVNEAGESNLGPDFDWDSLNEAEAEDVTNPGDADYQKDGDAAGSEKDAEGTKDIKPEVGAEVGDGKEVSGKEDSAESHADDETKEIDNAIGADDKQQTALEAAELVDMIEESVDMVLIEANLEKTAKDVADAIKKAIENLVKRAKEAFEKFKNTKVGAKIKDILNKANELLTEAKTASADKLDKLGKEAKKLSDQLKSAIDVVKNVFTKDYYADIEDDYDDDDFTFDESAEVVEEKVSFKFLPSLKEDKDTHELWKAASEAETLLNGDGINTKSGALKAGKLALRILDIIQNINGFFSLVSCISIIGIPFHLLNQCWSVLYRLGEEAAAKEYMHKCIVELGKLIDKCDDEEKKAKLIEKRDDLQAKLDKAVSEAAEEGPLEDDDVAEREGEVPETAVETEGCQKENDDAEVEGDPGDTDEDEELSESIISKIKEKRAAKKAADGEVCEVCGKNPCECAKTEATDPIADPECPNDGDVRCGENVPDTKNVEGEKQEVLGAAMESAIEESVDMMLIEANIADTAKAAGEAIMNAIRNLVKRAKEAYEKFKNTKVGAKIKSILDKANELLTEAKSASAEKLEKLSDKCKELSDKLKAAIQEVKDNAKVGKINKDGSINAKFKEVKEAKDATEAEDVSVDEAVVLEFNLKDSVKNIVEAVKKALHDLIEKAKKALETATGAAKSKINAIIDKAKELLHKVEHINPEDESARDEVSDAATMTQDQINALQALMSNNGITKKDNDVVYRAEAAENIDDVLSDVDDDADIEAIANGEKVVPDDVQEADDANMIKPDIENTNEASIADMVKAAAESIKKAVEKLIADAKAALAKFKESAFASKIKGILDKAEKLLAAMKGASAEKLDAISAKCKELSAQLKEVVAKAKESVKKKVTKESVTMDWFSNITEAVDKKDIAADAAEDIDDEDIELIKNNKLPEANDSEDLEYCYDDDELIDIALNGEPEADAE